MSPVLTVPINRRKLRACRRPPADMEQQWPVSRTARTSRAVLATEPDKTLTPIGFSGSGPSGPSDHALWTHIRGMT